MPQNPDQQNRKERQQIRWGKKRKGGHLPHNPNAPLPHISCGPALTIFSSIARDLEIRDPEI